MSKTVKSTRPTRIHVVGPAGNSIQVRKMFSEEGYVIVKEDEGFDAVCFTGGEDITPFLYGERPLKINGVTKTHFNPDRDLDEVNFFHKLGAVVPKIGICRGGQLLNVLSGGRMYQHVTDHIGNHEMIFIDGFVKTKKEGERKPILKTVEVTSTHHQMMIPQAYGDIIGWASKSTDKYTQEEHIVLDPKKETDQDTEIVYYWHTNSLCFQPHPEYVSKGHPLREAFAKILDVHLNLTPLTNEYV